MKEIISDYWQEMYSDFQVGEKSFLIPEFPHALLSANFVFTPGCIDLHSSCNFVGDERGVMRQPDLRFKLHVFAKKHGESSFRLKQEPLSVAIQRDAFWFLSIRPLPHRHFYYEESGEMLCSSVVGFAPSAELLLNALVKKEVRQAGLMKEFFRDLEFELKAPYHFYWTKHPWLDLGSDLSYDYLIHSGNKKLSSR